MSGLAWREGVLGADAVPLPAIAETAGTPSHVDSATAICAAYRRLDPLFRPLGAKLLDAVEASPDRHLCGLPRGLGAGMDVVSGGGLEPTKAAPPVRRRRSDP